MVLYPGGGPGRSTAVNSPRHLTIRNTQRIVTAARTAQGLSLSPEGISASAVATVLSVTTKATTDSVSGSSIALAAATSTTADRITEASDDDKLNAKLKPGQEQIFSYWAPGLEAGKQHHIRVTQVLDGHKPGDKPLQLESNKTFSVEAPQFSLPGDSIHSVYPPQGYRDDARILPHVVLTNPHLPWERIGSPKTESDDQTAGGRPRTKVPWLILCSFTQEELTLPLGDLSGTDSIFARTSAGLVKPVQQSNTMTLNMSIADLLATSKTQTPVTQDNVVGSIKDTRGDFIFLRKEMFLNLFCTFDNDGTRHNPPVIDTVPYGLLAHVRHVNASGMALAGVEDSVVFSLVIGNRAGPVTIMSPATVAVHLLSIEGVEDMTLPFALTTEYVAMCSLYSWNYTVNPPGMVNVKQAFTSLGKTLDVLRPPKQVLQPLLPARSENASTPRSDIQLRVGARMSDGYTIVKHRLQTGEDTVAFFRGPFTPTVVSKTGPVCDRCSNSGQDLQILDPILGMMDITYSSAWQLGRVLALGDEGFITALGRLRTAIHRPAMKSAKIAAIRAINPTAYRSKQDVLSDLPSLVHGLADIQNLGKKPQHIASSQGPHDDGGGSDDGDTEEGGSISETASQSVESPQFEPGGIKKRWYRRRLRRREIPDLSFSSPAIQSRYPDAAEDSAERVSASIDGGIYNEINTPVSTDWMVVMTWLLGKMFLDGVPAHYLITDPSHLPEESLRFFYIDPNWVDALIDGALSLGNHRGRDEDRVAIKKAFNRHITTPVEGTNFAPQIPTYGFFLRSDLVSMYPDLRVNTLPPPDKLPSAYKDRAPLLRHTIIADGVMFGLLDRAPSSEIFTGLVFTQPPHQQRFAVGDSLNEKRLTINIRRQYTTPPPGQAPDDARHHTLPPPIINEPLVAGHPMNNLFIWGSEIGRNDLRILRTPQYAARQLAMLQGPWPKDANDPTGPSGGELSPNGNRYFQDDAVSSALFAMQLSDPNYTLTINFEADTDAGTRLTALLPTPGLSRSDLDLSTDPATNNASGALPVESGSSPRILNSLKPPLMPTLLASAGEQAGVVEEKGTSEDGNSDTESGTASEPFSHPPNYTPPVSSFSVHGPHVVRIPEIAAALEVPAPGDENDQASGVDTQTASSGKTTQSSSIVISDNTIAAAPATPSRALRVSSKSRDVGPGGMPSFDVNIYTRGVDTKTIEIPRDPTQQLAQDLIFSIRARDNDNRDAWKLMELNLTIPFGQPLTAAAAAATSSTSDYFLMSQYAGPGATMLSNLRFNILVALVTKDENPALQLRLLPRAKEGFIPINRVENISFLLALADINRWDGKIPKVAQPAPMVGAAADGSPPADFKLLHFVGGVKAQYYPRETTNPPRSQALDIAVFMRDKVTV